VLHVDRLLEATGEAAGEARVEATGTLCVTLSATVTSKPFKKKTQLQVEHPPVYFKRPLPGAGRSHLKMSLQSQSWAANGHWRLALKCVYDCDVEKVKRISADGMADIMEWGVK
jgi:hypothetical protein